MIDMNAIKKLGCVVLACLLVVCCMAGCKPKEESNTMQDTGNYIAMYPLPAKEAQQVEPNAYDLQLAIEKGLAKEEIYDADYLKVQAAYMALANYYLCQKAGLDGYQEQLEATGFHYAAPEESVYAKAGAFGRANIFMRNTMYVERLSEADLQLLRQSIHADTVDPNDEVLAMVERTLQQVIILRYDDSEAVFEARYDTGVFQTNFAPSNALVFVIAYEMDYDADGNIADNATEDRKLELAVALADMMAAEMEGELGIPVRVFVN